MHQYVIARTAAKRPTLMHKVVSATHAACGVRIDTWSRAYFNVAIPQLLCRNCEVSTK